MASANVEILSNWYHLLDGLQASTKDFYSSLDQAIKAREIPDARTSRVHFSEGGVLSAKREYFRVQRKGLIFDICAAPFGNAFFISWWLTTRRGCLSLLEVIPIVGPLILRFIRPVTYWNLDTTHMFQEAVRIAVLEVVDGITSAKGVRALSELERKPTLGEFFKK